MYGYTPALRAPRPRPRCRSDAVLALAVALLAGCGNGGTEAEPEPSPAPPPTTAEQPGPERAQLESVVREWSRALNADDNEAAADLFAPGAVIAQGRAAFVLRSHEDAVLFNSSLPCSGRIVELSTEGRVVTAVFVLGHRKSSRCDAAPGTRAAARFLIRRGKIAAWEQIPVPEAQEAAA